MKKLIFTLFGLLLYFSGFAQLQHFFPNSNSYFSVSYMKFWFEGEVVIDGLQYKKVYMQYDDPIADFSKAQYFAAIREDTDAEKVYCYYEGEEYLLYDFSVNVGDVVHFYSFWPYLRPREQVVESVDYVLIDNEYRRRINFLHDRWSVYTESWIEGIGSTNGLFFSGEFDYVDLMDETWLLCVHIDGRKIYQVDHLAIDNCFVPKTPIWGYENCVIDCADLGGTWNDCQFYCAPIFQEDKFRIFRACVRDCTDDGGDFGNCLSDCRAAYDDDTSVPKTSYEVFSISVSPAGERLLVETEFASASYVIYTALGSVVKRGNLSTPYIDISSLSAGVYFAAFYHKNGLIYTGKFVKF